VGTYQKPATIDLIITPGVAHSRAAIYVSSGIVGGADGVPSGHLGLRLVAGDLVGLTPAAATLKALHHVIRTLEHIVAGQGRPEAPAPPDGGHGGDLVNVPLPGLEPSTLT
jgi:hypothetical protein